MLNNLEHGVQLRPNDTDNENQHGNQDIYLQHPEKNNFARTKNRFLEKKSLFYKRVGFYF